MNKYFTLALTVLLTAGGCSNKTGHRHIMNLPAGYSPSSLIDCTVPVAFSSDDFRWMGGNLSMAIFQENTYDAVDISQIDKGDTIVYKGKDMVVTKLEEDHGTLSINGGVEEGGAWLIANGGGTYRATEFDDHSVYTELGKAEVPLAEDFIIIDCGDEPTDPSDTIRTKQKQYIESLADFKREFSPLNTTVCIQNGVITEIKRRWIP